MEAVAFLSLAVAGYVLNKRRRVRNPITNLQDFHDQMYDVYESNEYEKARKIEFIAASESYEKSLNPDVTNVIPRNFTDDYVQNDMTQRRQDPSIGRNMVSELSGLPTDFAHGSMAPFFGGRMKQNVDVSRPSLLEKFTGTTPQGGVPPPQKREIKPMFQPFQENIYGASMANPETERERLNTNKLRQGELNFEPIRVGPAIGGGYNGSPNDGYLEGREYQMPPTIDELRSIDRPQITYAGRTNAGSEQVASRGELGNVNGPRFDQRYKETNTSEDWMRTTGQNLGNASRPEQIVRDVTKPCTHVPYAGAAGPTATTAATYASQGQQTTDKRQTTNRLPFGPASAVNVADKLASLRSDFGKANILVYANERDTTSVPIFAGSAYTLVKSIVAPLLDVMRPAKRQVLGTNAARSFGNTSLMIPNKQTIRDQNGVLRTTIRETNQQFSSYPGASGSFKGPTVLPVYDPSEIARTTMKEQVIHDGAGPSNHTIPSSSARRTTTRDPESEIVRNTLWETLEPTNTSVNPTGVQRGMKLRDPELVLRNTVKETTVVAGVAETNGTTLGGLQGEKGGYTSSDMTMLPTTTREFTENDGRVGGVGTSSLTSGDGYRVTNSVPRETQKQSLSDHSFYGVGRTQGGADAPMSHEEFENATIRTQKESISMMERRDFNASGMKVALGKEDVSSETRKPILDARINDWLGGKGRIMPSPSEAVFAGVESHKFNEYSDVCTHANGSLSEVSREDTRFEDDVTSHNLQKSSNSTASPSFFTNT